MPDDKDQPSPRVFISYSWTSQDHLDWVASLGEKLRANGVDVILDQWDLKEGHDLHAFMEQMVLDPKVIKVLVVCDAKYAEKANARKGGVGKESLIISAEVYEKAGQEKFIPIIRECDSTGAPCVPVFLKGRKYFDFSTSDLEAAQFELLVRNIFDRPLRQKPPLGKPPASIFDDQAISIPAAQKAIRFHDAAASGRGANPAAKFADFVEEFIANFNELRMQYSPEQNLTWRESVLANIERARVYRDVFANVVRDGARFVNDPWFSESVLQFLERLVPFAFRPAGIGSYFECSEDNFRFLLYEFFLYTIATFVKAQRYVEAAAIIRHKYVCPEYFGGGNFQSFGVDALQQYCDTLDTGRGGPNPELTLTGKLIVDRANRTDIRPSDLIQADALCALATIYHNGDYSEWKPRTIFHAPEFGTLELFVRAESETGFKALKTILNIEYPGELIARIESKSISQLSRHLRVHLGTIFNVNRLKQVWEL